MNVFIRNPNLEVCLAVSREKCRQSIEQRFQDTDLEVKLDSASTLKSEAGSQLALLS